MLDGLGTLTHDELASLGREYLLAGHLIDRASMPQVLSGFGRQAMLDMAIEEWMGASPVYTRRMQRSLGFCGNDVPTVFKGMQFDIGAPHEFMDFRYRVIDEAHGEFWLAHCGALLDVEPMGEEFVLGMCHHIEDPTFDATACATNPRARVRPIHRPPRQPSNRHPHCHWTVSIDASADPLVEPAVATAVAGSRAARLPLTVPGPDPATGHLSSYAGPFRPELRLEDLGRNVLLVVADEVCLQGHLLVYSFLFAAERRFGKGAARRLGVQQCTGVAGVVAARLARARGLQGGGLDAVSEVFALHPAFRPRAYVDLQIERRGHRLMVGIGDCPALHEVGDRSWAAVLAAGASGPIEAVARAVDPRTRCEPAAMAHARPAWEVTLDVDRPPAIEAPEVTLTKFSRGAEFVFAR